jgi:hypothetical protein
LPTSAGDTDTAHSTGVPAVKFNKVYLAPLSAVGFDEQWLGAR